MGSRLIRALFLHEILLFLPTALAGGAGCVPSEGVRFAERAPPPVTPSVDVVLQAADGPSADREDDGAPSLSESFACPDFETVDPDSCRRVVASASDRATSHGDGSAVEVEGASVWVPPGIPLDPCQGSFFDRSVEFQPGTAMPKVGEEGVIALLAETIRANPHVELVEVRGYATQAATDEAQVALSVERAHVVADALVRLGVPPDRLLVAGYGNRCPDWGSLRLCLPDPNDRVGLSFVWANGSPVPGPRICPAGEELLPPIPDRFLHRDAEP